MRTYPAEKIRNLMNKASSEASPFFFAVDYEMSEGLFLSKDEISAADILFRFPHLSNAASKPAGISKGGVSAKINPFEEYQNKFDIVMEGILRGDTYLANLTVKTEISCPLGLDEIFFASNSPFAMLAPEKFVCFSPERFVRIENGKIWSCPMKGTIEASVENAEARILESPKEFCEHNTIVDLIRNDLGAVADNIELRRFRYIDKISRNGRGDILAVSSEIMGDLKNDMYGDVIFSMLPAGSVSGAPKKRTVEILRTAEREKRGYYTGVFGYFDGFVLDSAVIIRYIEEAEGKKYYRSGGGITVNSSCQMEYDEALSKIYLPF